MHMCMFKHIHAHSNAHIYIHIYVYIQMYAHIQIIPVYSNIYTYSQTYTSIFKCINVYSHTHTHTHTQTPPPPPHPEEGMATYSSTHAWRTPWTEEPIGLQSMGPQRVGQDWNNVGRTHPWCHVSTVKIPVISLLNIVCPSCSSVPHPGSR